MKSETQIPRFYVVEQHCSNKGYTITAKNNGIKIVKNFNYCNIITKVPGCDYLTINNAFSILKYSIDLCKRLDRK